MKVLKGFERFRRFWKVSKGFERFQKVSKGFERIRKVPEGSERFSTSTALKIWIFKALISNTFLWKTFIISPISCFTIFKKVSHLLHYKKNREKCLTSSASHCSESFIYNSPFYDPADLFATLSVSQVLPS